MRWLSRSGLVESAMYGYCELVVSETKCCFRSRLKLAVPQLPVAHRPASGSQQPPTTSYEHSQLGDTDCLTLHLNMQSLSCVAINCRCVSKIIAFSFCAYYTALQELVF